MKKSTALTVGLGSLIIAAIALAPSSEAGGPLIVRNGKPVVWANQNIIGGALNSQTVDISTGHRRILYRVDSGPLGTLSNQNATALVDAIFSEYSAIPTADIEYANAGSIRDPFSGQPIDVNSTNIGRVAGNTLTFQNPIIFDHDGSIVGGNDVLGFAGVMGLTNNGEEVVEGVVVLNGQVLSLNILSEPSFLGVFTHEFGHFAGPLDHAQINGNIALNGDGAVLPPGFSEAQAYDLYAPFTESLFPFLFDGPFGSQLRNQFEDTGFFIATLDMDTQNAMSDLYPMPGYRATDAGSPNGAIEGRVVVRTSSGDIPITGVNVVARRISQGVYPPPPGTQAYPGGVINVVDGIPNPPPAQGATDPLATASSAVTGLVGENGTYRLDGLPPGQYLVEIQTILPQAVGGSSIGPLGNQIFLPVQEFYSGPRESATDDPNDIEPIDVIAGQVTSGIDVVLNGFSDAGITMLQEKGKTFKLAKAQTVPLPVEITGSASISDKSKVRLLFGDGLEDKIEDFFRFNLTDSRTLFLILEATSGVGDLDLWLFTGDLMGKKISVLDSRIIDASISADSSEFLGLQLPAGSYIIGVSAFSGSQSYRLRALVSGS